MLDGFVAERCGLTALYSPDRDYPAARMLHEAQTYLRHRGQASHGIAAVSRGNLSARVTLGRVMSDLPDADYDALAGSSGIGHNRYRTAGLSGKEYAQPFLEDGFALAHNGTISNASALATRLLREGARFRTGKVLDSEGWWAGQYDVASISDSEVIGKLIARRSSIVDGIQYASTQLEGAYCLVLLDEAGGIYAVRDPRGMKPLCRGRGAKAVGFFSENCVFSSPDLGMSFEADIEPGTIHYVGRGEEKTFDLPGRGAFPRALDIFELVYFASRRSDIDGISVALFRQQGGTALAKKCPNDKVRRYPVVPVPLSGIDWSLGYHRETRHPYASWFERMRDVRSFIEDSPEARQRAAARKLALVTSLIKADPRAYLVDDSLVRGTTMRRLVSLLREAGAEEIHLRIGYPAVVDVCPWGGIDMRTKGEHFANQFPDTPDRERELGVDSLVYNDPADLIVAANKARVRGNVQLTERDFCTHCITHRNPFERPGASRPPDRG